MFIAKRRVAVMSAFLVAPVLASCGGDAGGGGAGGGDCRVSADDIGAAYADEATLLPDDDESAVSVREDRWEGGTPPDGTCFYLLEQDESTWISVTISAADSAEDGKDRFDSVAEDGRLTEVGGAPVAASDDDVVVVNVDDSYYVVHQEMLQEGGNRDSSPLSALETVVPLVVEAG